jgi:isoleucyl-tRNA synthetase
VRGIDEFVEDLSNWYIRRSRSRFWDGDETALRTLWVALVQTLRVIAPVMPFLADELWRVLVADASEGAPDSVHLAGWPEVVAPDEQLLEEVAEVRGLVELGRQARAQAGIKLRQPLRQVVVFGAELSPAYEKEIKEELRVDEVRFEEDAAARVRYKPNLPVLGPRLGPRLPEIRRALERDEFEVEGENLVVDGEVLTPDDVLQERLPVTEGWVVAADGDLSVELDPSIDQELELRGRVLDLVHAVNVMRKEAGLELTDRIALTVPHADHDLLAHEEHIKRETLATRVELGAALELEKA